eukprot:12480-Eustigmatos_ZCMA.PRE.1
MRVTSCGRNTALLRAPTPGVLARRPAHRVRGSTLLRRRMESRSISTASASATGATSALSLDWAD